MSSVQLSFRMSTSLSRQMHRSEPASRVDVKRGAKGQALDIYSTPRATSVVAEQPQTKVTQTSDSTDKRAASHTSRIGPETATQQRDVVTGRLRNSDSYLMIREQRHGSRVPHLASQLPSSEGQTLRSLFQTPIQSPKRGQPENPNNELAALEKKREKKADSLTIYPQPKVRAFIVRK